ncbi:calmodulin-binding protein 60 B-like [Bidens hawaiensis]|uniref:calmodulin-binding protein 60 B-like n=1 Tax=Bidens hawaiensis TaxID=980011 RepID=UPI00404B4DA6
MQRKIMEKRGLDPSSSEQGQPEKKRPALASVIVEALKVDSLQKLCSSLEPILRRVVSEEVERALAKLGPAKINGRVSPKRIEGPDGSDLQLHFRSKLSLPLFTGGKVEGERGAAIHVVLIDANTGHLVTTGPESSVKLDIVVLEGDFNNEDEEGWTQEEFETHVVKEREGKRPLLSGELQVQLKEGVGTLGELSFTDNSSWIRSRKFRLGLKVASGYSEGIRVREAKTDAFTVKDHRGELYKKHYPPALTDEVWRLEKIGKDGSFHKKLNKANIFSVEDFLRLVVRDPKKLRNILGSGMSNKMWDVLVEHAKTCILSPKLYVYYSDEMRNIGVVFNHIYELSGLVADGHYYSTDALTDNQKVFVDTLMKKAYDNWMQVVEYDGKSFLGAHQIKTTAPQLDMGMGPQNYSNSFDHQLSLPPPAAQEQPNSNPGVTLGGYDSNVTTRYCVESQNMNLNAPTQFDTTFTLHNPMINSSQQPLANDNNILALGLTQPSASNFLSGNTNTLNLSSSFRGLEEYFPEEEIRMRSHEMLENEDMQHLLRLFNMGNNGAHGQTSGSQANENYYQYSSGYMPNTPSNFGYGFDVDKTRSSGKAVVGWLKLKAALRWGIFIRKQAAERRAQIVELEDDE